LEKQSVLHNLRGPVFVAVFIHHAMRMRHIVICGLPRSATVYPHYLINGTTFEKKKLLKTECVFRVSLQLLSETSAILRRIKRAMIKMYFGLHVK
jgi:hypothetical protein